MLETTDLLSDPVGLLLGKLFINLKCLRTAEPKGPGLEIAALGDYSVRVIMRHHQTGKSAISGVGGSSGTFVVIDYL